MFINVDDRQTGKTITLIKDAYFTGLPIVVASVRRKEYLLDMAKRMFINNISVFTVSELSNIKESKTLESGVMVDDLEDVLHNLLGVRVVKANIGRKLF